MKIEGSNIRFTPLVMSYRSSRFKNVRGWLRTKEIELKTGNWKRGLLGVGIIILIVIGLVVTRKTIHAKKKIVKNDLDFQTLGMQSIHEKEWMYKAFGGDGTVRGWEAGAMATA